jgi:hypothetical protein
MRKAGTVVYPPEIYLRYVIYEKGPSAGQFWTQYPIQNELISINANSDSKRYDWHSMLRSPVRFRDFSKK